MGICFFPSIFKIQRVFLFNELQSKKYIVFRKEFDLIIIGNERKMISQVELAEFPQFLRFRKILLYYRCYEEKCQIFINTLRPLKKALNDSNLIQFEAICDQNDQTRTHFGNHSQILNHLQKELLPICEFSRGYSFTIWFYSAPEMNAGTNVIASLIQMPSIDHDRCLNLEIELGGFTGQIMQLPVEEISNWLTRKCDGIDENKKANGRFLQIYSSFNFQNVREMFENLKKVITNLNVQNRNRITTYLPLILRRP